MMILVQQHTLKLLQYCFARHVLHKWTSAKQQKVTETRRKNQGHHGCTQHQYWIVDYNYNYQEAQLMLTNLRDAFGGQSGSPNIVPFHMLCIVSFCAIVTLSLRRAVFTVFDFKKCRDLEMGSKVAQGH